jgi:hypothetical protein
MSFEDVEAQYDDEEDDDDELLLDVGAGELDDLVDLTAPTRTTRGGCFPRSW